jgi:hypothetical protein
MNRDERRTRAPALPPTRVTPDGVPALIPVDGEAGGSWISLNAHGHTLALLNRYEDSPHDPAGTYLSRGLLLIELAGYAGPEAVDHALVRRPLTSFRPFTLASVAPGSDPWLFEWNGRVLERARSAAPGLLRTSSGRDQAAAERIRGALFTATAQAPGGLTPTILAALHRSHQPGRGPFSICMHREEATTVSCSLITVSPTELLFCYVNGSPGESTDISHFTLPRSGPSPA